MDLPRAQMSKEQRVALVEWEKRVAELAEEGLQQARHLEAERKLLEVEVMDIVIEFNARLAVLHEAKVRAPRYFRCCPFMDCDTAVVLLRKSKDGGQVKNKNWHSHCSLPPRILPVPPLHAQVKMDLECRAHELQALSAATQVDAVLQAILRRRHYEAVLLPGLRALLERRSSVVAAAKQVAVAALRGYEELHVLEKQVILILRVCLHIMCRAGGRCRVKV